MQGQGSSSNSLRGSLYAENGSNVSRVPAEASVVHPVTNLSGQSSPNVDNQMPVRFLDLLAEDGLLSSPHSTAGLDQPLEERNSESNITPFQQSFNMNMLNAHHTNGPSVFSQASTGGLSHQIDLNDSYEGNGMDAFLDVGTGLILSPFTSEGSDDEPDAPTGDSSSSGPLLISSGIAGYVLEENEGGQGSSSDSRRLSCKRRAPENASRKLYLGGSSRSVQQAGSSEYHAMAPVSFQEQLGTGPMVGVEAAPDLNQPSNVSESGLGAGTGAIFNMHSTSSVVGQSQDYQRNLRVRRDTNQDDFVPTNVTASTPRNLHVQSPGQPVAICPFGHLPGPIAAAGVQHPTPTMQPLVHAPQSSQTLQPFNWNGDVNSRNDVPCTAALTINGGNVIQLEGNSRNNEINHMLSPELQGGNLGPANYGDGIFPGHIASSSQIASSSHVRQPSSQSWFPQNNMAEQYAQRVSDIVNHSESLGLRGYCPMHSSASAAAAIEIGSTRRRGNARSPQVPFTSGLTIRDERQTVDHPEMLLQPLPAAQRRSRLVSEVRNVLALMRRGGSIQFEDFMVIDRTVLYGVPEEPDLHEDMRLDVDDMSYEELLALEEQIGNVSTGLSEDAILAHLKRQKHRTIASGSPTEDEPCCICQEEYADGEDVGKLNCGHDFHVNCIKQWLEHKNVCPICKVTALDV